MMDARPEGVYCHWETYPPSTLMEKNNILVIERVNGDGTVSEFSCSRDETHAILKILMNAAP